MHAFLRGLDWRVGWPADNSANALILPLLKDGIIALEN